MFLSKQFNIRCPLGRHNQEIYYNDKDDRVELLQKLMLNYWEGYCNAHWIWLYKFDPNKRNYEDKTKSFLSRCADFLLYNRYKDTNIVTPHMNKKIKTNEYSLDGDWQNENLEIELEETVSYLSKFVKEEHKQLGEMATNKYDNKVEYKKHTSKTSRILDIYSDNEKKIEDYKKIHISNTFNVWGKSTKRISARKGLIDKENPYISEWCVVDTENVFEFEGNKYKISEDVKQYKVRAKKPKYDDYKLDYQMDQILVYEQDDNLFFFDQNINQIENNKVIKV